MSQSITINLPDDTRDALNSAATEEGLSESALIEKAVSDYLFIRRFRNLRDRMMSQGKSLNGECSLEEFERDMDLLTQELEHLPANYQGSYSRDDIYSDHD
jgi:hypothetical protein